MTAEELEAYRTELRRQLDMIRVGAWQMMCCQEDLYEIETEEEAEQFRRELTSEIESGCYKGAPTIFATELDGLKYCRAMKWTGESAEDAKRRCDDLDRRIIAAAGSTKENP